jgi:hypothetical protein
LRKKPRGWGVGAGKRTMSNDKNHCSVSSLIYSLLFTILVFALENKPNMGYIINVVPKYLIFVTITRVNRFSIRKKQE